MTGGLADLAYWAVSFGSLVWLHIVVRRFRQAP